MRRRMNPPAKEDANATEVPATPLIIPISCILYPRSTMYGFSIADQFIRTGMIKNALIIGSEVMPFVYDDCQKEMDMINKAFIEVMTEGDRNGRIFTFPIPTYNLTKDFDWENPNAKLLFEMSAKFGIPYFQNFINSNLNTKIGFVFKTMIYFQIL